MTERYRTVQLIAFTLVVMLLAGWIYWPGNTGPILLDDRSSVMVIGDLRNNPQLALDYVLGDESGALGRPVSMASFVLEKLILDGSVATAKSINILLHLFNGCLVFWLFCLLFRHIGVAGYHYLALVLAAGWLLSPLYVSTVLYIVQRMAMLSATFMLLACIFYIYWRLKLASGSFSTGLAGLVLLSFALALFSKENAIVLVPILLVVEALWFEFLNEDGETIRWLQRCALSCIGMGAICLAMILILDYEGLASAFGSRYFTLDERLLTEARILWDYVGQIFAPEVFRMGLYHDDVTVSESLVSPPSTQYAVVAWLAVVLVLFAAMFWRWGRYLALGGVWFLLGHSVESTVLPLELYFEHRNYFPGIGLFLSVGVVFGGLVKRWPEIKNPLLVYLGCYAIWLASLTSSQVQIWSNQHLLVLSHLNAHPDSFRANADMSVQLAQLGDFEASRKYSARAFEVNLAGEHVGDHDIRDLALSCIANQKVAAARIDELGKTEPERPFGSVTTLLTLVRLLQDDACPVFDRLRFSDRMVEIFLGHDSVATASPKIYSSLALLENVLQRWEYADAYMDKFLQLSPDNINALLMKLHFSSALGKVEEIDRLKTLLRELDSQGKLTVGEQQTLALYLEK